MRRLAAEGVAGRTRPYGVLPAEADPDYKRLRAGLPPETEVIMDV